MPDAEHTRQAALAEQLITVTRAIKDLEADRQQLLDELDTLHEAGLVDDKFSWHDFAFSWSAGRASYDYPDEVTTAEVQLKALKETAIELGTATQRPSKPFWTIRPPKA
jgi:hypothetical protein